VSIQPKPKKIIVSIIAMKNIKNGASTYSSPMPEEPSQSPIVAELTQRKFHNFSGP
jgi:hypothetical protein